MENKSPYIEYSEIFKTDVIYSYEPYFDNYVIIAIIDHEKKEIRPTHGYFSPHPQSSCSKRTAKRLGYTFNNN